MESQNKEMKIAAIRLKLPTSQGDATLTVPCDIALQRQDLSDPSDRHLVNFNYQLVIPSTTLLNHGAIVTNINGNIVSYPVNTKLGLPDHVVRLTIDLTGWVISPNNYGIFARAIFAKILDASPGYAHYLMSEVGYTNTSIDELTLEYVK